MGVEKVGQIPQREQVQGAQYKDDRFRQKEKIRAQKEKIRSFIERVKEHGVFESVDERRRNIVEGYTGNEEATFGKLRDQAGGVSTNRVIQLYFDSLSRYWDALPEEARQGFREEEILGSATGEPNSSVLARQWREGRASMIDAGEVELVVHPTQPPQWRKLNK